MAREDTEPAGSPDFKKRYLDVRELSDYLGISKWMIYKFIEVRAIPFIPFGRVIRFDRMAIDRWTEKRTIFTAPGRRAQGQPNTREPFYGLNRSSYCGAAADPDETLPS